MSENSFLPGAYYGDSLSESDKAAWPGQGEELPTVEAKNVMETEAKQE